MNSKDIVSLYEAYAAVYDEDLRDDLEFSSIQEDLSFVDDLSDNELDQVMEDIFVSGDIDINECFDSLDYVLSEARVTSSDDRPSGSARVTVSSERPSRVARTAERQRQVRIGRIAQAAQRAGEKTARGAYKVGGAISGSAERTKGKLASAASKIKGFLGKVGAAAKAGASAAKKEFSGQAEREAQARTTGRQMRRVARRQASAERGRDTSEFTKKSSEKPSDPWSGSATKPSSKSSTTKSTRALSGSPARPALPAAKTKTISSRRQEAAAKLASKSTLPSSGGVSFAGPGGVSKPATTKKSQKTSMGASSGVKRTARKVKSVAENYELLADLIAQDLITEGYASDILEAYDFIIEMNNNDVQDVVESYLVEETEVVDLYDVVLEHLLDEGFAETEEAATVIMANMSEEWRDEILGEATDNVIMTVKSPSGQERSKIRKGAWGPSDSHRHENPEQIANRRFSQQLADRKKERQERMRAGRLTVATKRGIEAATNKSDRTDFTPDSSLRANERDELPTDYRARRRRASGR